KRIYIYIYIYIIGYRFGHMDLSVKHMKLFAHICIPQFIGWSNITCGIGLCLTTFVNVTPYIVFSNPNIK
ncbi:unnamed protein product, partial [Prunus brigantina]